MLREELEFKMRMRASLRGIVQLDPVGVPARLVELDREIQALERAVDAEGRAGIATVPKPRLRAA